MNRLIAGWKGSDPDALNSSPSRRLVKIGLYALGGILLTYVIRRLTRKPEEENGQRYIPGVQEKSTLGGLYNTGVTSSDPEEKALIEKQGNFAKLKAKN